MQNGGVKKGSWGFKVGEALSRGGGIALRLQTGPGDAWGLKWCRCLLTCCTVQLLDLRFVGVNQELVKVVFGGGLVVIPPRNERNFNMLDGCKCHRAFLSSFMAFAQILSQFAAFASIPP